jgi:hypothetical protein
MRRRDDSPIADGVEAPDPIRDDKNIDDGRTVAGSLGRHRR